MRTCSATYWIYASVSGQKKYYIFALIFNYVYSPINYYLGLRIQQCVRQNYIKSKMAGANRLPCQMDVPSLQYITWHPRGFCWYKTFFLNLLYILGINYYSKSNVAPTKKSDMLLRSKADIFTVIKASSNMF